MCAEGGGGGGTGGGVEVAVAGGGGGAWGEGLVEGELRAGDGVVGVAVVEVVGALPETAAAAELVGVVEEVGVVVGLRC